MPGSAGTDTAKRRRQLQQGTPSNALLADDGVTPLLADDGVTILLQD